MRSIASVKRHNNVGLRDYRILSSVDRVSIINKRTWCGMGQKRAQKHGHGRKPFKLDSVFIRGRRMRLVSIHAHALSYAYL
jgi:hypothetical protein